MSEQNRNPDEGDAVVQVSESLTPFNWLAVHFALSPEKENVVVERS